jgi:DNA-binding XRE family transcriptional regulator
MDFSDVIENEVSTTMSTSRELREDELKRERKRGQCIKKLRESRGLTQAEVALFLGVTVQTIINRENGKGWGSLEVWRKLCDLLGIDMNIQTLLNLDEMDLNFLLNSSTIEDSNANHSDSETNSETTTTEKRCGNSLEEIQRLTQTTTSSQPVSQRNSGEISK